MKKLVCLLVALILCVSCAAFAAAANSPTTGGMTTGGASQTTTAPVEAFTLKIITAEDEELLAIAAKEIEKVAASESVEAYFGELGADLKAKVEADTLNVNELHPVVASSYKAEMGDVTASFAFATPYAVGDKVVVTIGLVTVNEDGTQNVEWTAFDAAVVAENTVEATFDSATVLAIQEGVALLAVVSK